MKERAREEEGRIVAASASANEFLNWQRWKLQLLVRQVFSSSSCCMSVCLPDGQSSDNSNREDSEYCSMLLYYLLLISSLPPPPPVHLLCAHTGLAKCICMRLDIIRTLTHKRRMTMRWPLRWWTSKRRRRKVNGYSKTMKGGTGKGALKAPLCLIFLPVTLSPPSPEFVARSSSSI